MARFQFRLFIAGRMGNSIAAVANIKAIGNQMLGGDFELQIIDVLERPELADREKITATPTLIKDGPFPSRRLIGDLSHTPRVLAGLGLTAENEFSTFAERTR